MLTIKENNLILQFAKDPATGKIGLVNFGNALIDTKDKALDQYSLNQVHVAGGDRDAHQGGKMIRASESSQAVFVEHKVHELNGSKEYEIITVSDKVRISTFYKFFDGIDVVAVRNSVTNISDKPIVLEETNGLFLHGLLDSGERAVERLNLHIPHNSWHTECQWKSYPLTSLGLMSGNGNLSQKRIGIGNVGTWSTKEYLPMGMLEDRKSGEFCLWQIESCGSWYYELGEEMGKIYLNAGGPSYDHGYWAKTLNVGESYTGATVSVTLGSSLESVMGSITQYRRRIRRPNADNITMPVIYNSYMHFLWDYPTEQTLKPIIDKVADMGVEYFCIDAGWHDEEDWWKKLGAYQESKTRFPNGVKGVIDYILAKGMKAGLWVEIENMGIECKALGELPEECYFRRNGEKVLNHNRLSLDFSHPLVIERANRIISQMMSYGIEYIKIDYNIDGGVGTESHGCPGEGLERHLKGYVDWLKSLYTKYPHLVIENCASGGGRMDYVMLSVHSVQSTSDQTNYKLYPYIAANMLTAVTPEQAAVWSYPLESGQNPESVTAEDVALNMVNCLMGRMHLASDFCKLDKTQISLIEEGIDFYNLTKSFKSEALPIFPLGFAEFGQGLACTGLKSGKRILLAVWSLGEAKNVIIPLESEIDCAKISYPAKLQGVDLTINNNQILLNFPDGYFGRIIDIMLK